MPQRDDAAIELIGKQRTLLEKVVHSRRTLQATASGRCAGTVSREDAGGRRPATISVQPG